MEQPSWMLGPSQGSVIPTTQVQQRFLVVKALGVLLQMAEKKEILGQETDPNSAATERAGPWHMEALWDLPRRLHPIRGSSESGQGDYYHKHRKQGVLGINMEYVSRGQSLVCSLLH